MKHVDLGENRNCEGVQCTAPACHGYAPRDDDEPVPAGYGCGRDGCCAAVFKCLRCNSLQVGSWDAPDLGW